MGLRPSGSGLASYTTTSMTNRPTTLPRRDRSTILAGYARSSLPASRVRRTCHGMCYFPPYGRAHPAPDARWSAMSNVINAATRFASSDASRRRYDPRATVIGNANADPTRPLRSTPCASGRNHAVTSFRHAFCMAAPVVPLRFPIPPRYVTEGAREGSTFRANRYGFARANVIGNVDGGCTRHEDPGLSHLLRRKEQQVRQSPKRNAALRRAHFVVPVGLPASPA